jgi:ATP-dependent DNA helicase RecQ
MSHYFPQNLESFQRITGVGAMKLTQYGEQFLAIIKYYARENDKEAKDIPLRQKELKLKGKFGGESEMVGKSASSGQTFQKTKELFLQKLSLSRIAERRGLNTGTILSHLEKLLEEGEKIDIAHLAPSAQRLEKIRAAFKESGGPILAPVRRLLGEDFSYEELRLARIFIKNEI